MNRTLRRIDRLKAEVGAEASRRAAEVRGPRVSAAADLAEKNDLLGYYKDARAEGLNHEAAIRETITSILVSPDVLYRVDHVDAVSPAPSRQAPRLKPRASSPTPLSDYALASRLSYFVWASMPDEKLLAHAAAGDLHLPAVLTSETRRMLHDPRARALAVEFGGNWLNFRGFNDIGTVDHGRFPEFTNELKAAMFEEPVRLLHGRVPEEPLGARSRVRHRHVRERAAREALRHARRRRRRRPSGCTSTDANKYDRGGLLPMAAFLTKNAPGLRTSPVKRGNWVVKNVLGERISPPPPGVPQLPPDETKLVLSLRDTMARHRSDPACATCHAKFDAMGLVFEGYGPIGEKRTKDLGRPGHRHVRRRSPAAVRARASRGCASTSAATGRTTSSTNMSEKLLAYALGRSLMLTDEPLIQDIRPQAGRRRLSFQYADRIDCHQPPVHDQARRYRERSNAWLFLVERSCRASV